MEKPKIAIASVLKPLMDARAFYRIGLSLRETNKYHLNIIGFSLKNEPSEKDLNYFKLFDQKRSAFKRIFVNIKFLGLLKKIKPKILIVTTYELLPTAVFMKFLLRYKLIYDLQENYILNIRQNKTLPKWKQNLAVFVIGLVERVSKAFVDQYIFAEICYQNEFPKIKNFIVLENKFYGEIKPIEPVKYEPQQAITFLISGTLTPIYGVIEAMHWFTEILKNYPNVRMLIIGHSPITSYGKKIKEIASKVPEINLQIYKTPVDYKQILLAYATCDIVLLPYYQVPSISPKIPSKMYECLAMGKPFIFSPNLTWKSIAKRYNAGHMVNFSELEHAQIELKKIFKQEFYSQGMDKFPYWKSKEHQLLEKTLAYLLKD